MYCCCCLHYVSLHANQIQKPFQWHPSPAPWQHGSAIRLWRQSITQSHLLAYRHSRRPRRQCQTKVQVAVMFTSRQCCGSLFRRYKALLYCTRPPAHQCHMLLPLAVLLLCLADDVSPDSAVDMKSQRCVLHVRIRIWTYKSSCKCEATWSVCPNPDAPLCLILHTKNICQNTWVTRI